MGAGKVVIVGAVGLTALYYTGLANQEGGLTTDPETGEDLYYDATSDPQLDWFLATLQNLGISLATTVAVKALYRGGKVVAKATGKAVGKAGATVVGKVTGKTVATVATKAVESAVVKGAEKAVIKGAENVAIKSAEKAVIKGAESAVVKGAEKAVIKGAENVAIKGAENVAIKGAENVAIKGAENTAVKAGESAIVKSGTTGATGAVAKSATVAAKSSKAAGMMSALKATPWQLIIFVISQILQSVLELDPENFAPCENGEFDMDSFPDWAKTMISAIPLVGDLFDLIGNKLCFRTGCANGAEELSGLCYEPCRAGFKSDAGEPFTCFKQYPAFENNGMLHTYINLTKKFDTVVGEVPSETPPGYDKQGALAYPACKAGYNGVLDRCWASIQKVNTVGRIPDKAGCPNGWRDDGTSCWDDVKTTGGGCRGGGCHTDCSWGGWMNTVLNCSTSCEPVTCDPIVTTGSGTIKMTLFDRQSCGWDEDKIDGLCYKKCPAGMEHVPGAPYDCRTIGDISYSRGAGEPLKCKNGKRQDGALCYDDRPGWNLLAGTYSQQCPSGATDIGVGCQRERYYRPAGLIPMGVRMKSRK